MYNSRLPFFVEFNDWAEYIDNDMNSSLYPFGYGLSYTQYEYSDLKLNNTVQPDGKLKVSFRLKNISHYKGDEVAQIYIRDCVSSIVRPVKQLAGFAKVSLALGRMEFFVGASSQDIRLQGTFEIVGEKYKVERKVFSSEVTVR